MTRSGTDAAVFGRQVRGLRAIASVVVLVLAHVAASLPLLPSLLLPLSSLDTTVTCPFLVPESGHGHFLLNPAGSGLGAGLDPRHVGANTKRSLSQHRMIQWELVSSKPIRKSGWLELHGHFLVAQNAACCLDTGRDSTLVCGGAFKQSLESCLQERCSRWIDT